MKIKLLAAVLSICASTLACAQEKLDDKFIAEIICQGQKSFRFEKSPTFSIVGDPGVYRKMILEVVSELNAVWEGLPVQIIVVADNDKKADIVYNTKPITQAELSKAFDVDREYKNGYIFKATIISNWLPEWTLGEPDKRGAYHKIMNAMGFANVGEKIRKDSMWSVSSYIGERLPMTPTEIDKQAIRFKYEIPSGTDKWKVRELAKKTLK